MINLFITLISAFSFLLAQPNNDTVTINVTDSKIEWTGRKVTGKHNGTIAIKEGTLNFQDSVLTGGSFVIDMTTITVTDLSGGGKAKLEGHLKSDDFFGVENFPTASFVIKSASPKGGGLYDITGDLTIKGITNPVSFVATVSYKKTGCFATALITVDRTLYNVRYGSGKFFDNLGDSTIHDEFELAVTLVSGS